MTPETEALLQKARQSQRAFVALKRAGFLDFAASRAGYAMFYAAQALWLSRGLSFSSHAAVIAAFGKAFAKIDSATLDLKTPSTIAQNYYSKA
jgi:uncharacterized protein (UPF0332 family)